MTDFKIGVIFTAHFGDGSEIKVHGDDIEDLRLKRGSCEAIQAVTRCAESWYDDMRTLTNKPSKFSVFLHTDLHTDAHYRDGRQASKSKLPLFKFGSPAKARDYILRQAGKMIRQLGALE